MNRLLTNGESGYPQTYGYDSVGNRWVTNANVLSSFTPQTQDWFDAQTNRLSHVDAQFQYDAGVAGGAGNLTGMGGYALVYDAENRQTKSTLGSAVTQYWYDGDGKRVKKQAGTATTVYVYDASGELAAEYGGTQTAGTQYVVQDHLGSTRMVVDAVGNCQALHDYLPFW